jgi:hypothetical protein
MSAAIDEIMSDVQSFACTWALVGSNLDDGGMYNTAEERSSALRELITAAIAEARREGAEQMREAIAHQAEINALYGVHGTTVSTIRAMPLPTGPRQAVRLTDDQITALVDGYGWGVAEALIEDIPEMAREIETAVLAANGLGTK